MEPRQIEITMEQYWSLKAEVSYLYYEPTQFQGTQRINDKAMERILRTYGIISIQRMKESLKTSYVLIFDSTENLTKFQLQYL